MHWGQDLTTQIKENDLKQALFSCEYLELRLKKLKKKIREEQEKSEIY